MTGGAPRSPDDRIVDERLRYLDLAQHKLKTPLSIMAGWASTLEQWELLTEDERAEGIAALQRASAEVQHQVVDVLDEARAHVLAQSLEPEPVDAGTLVLDAVSLAGAGDPARRTQVDADDGATATADPRALRLVVRHLLENAWKYSPAGEEVEVVVRAGSPLRLVVRDHGIGLGDDVDVFAPFERSQEARTVARGTGLGLHVVRMLVRAMHGDVRAEPAEGGGTVVTVELPGGS